MARKLAAVVFTLGALQADSVLALGLGELQLDSYLNEPLKASVDLLNMDGLHGDEIKIRLATREDFKKLGLDRSYFLTSIKFDIEVDGGKARIVMSSDEPVLEPYLDFIVEARWPNGRLLREYTVLIDPPVFADGSASPVVSASERVEEVEGIPAPAKKKTSEVSSSGTTVGLKKSDLAPGMMPERDFNAQTSAVPMAGSKYMVHRDQTLWEIASQAKPGGASVHQTMLDIQRLNPDAFINGNINNIKAGYIVYLPTADDISSGDLSSALAEVKEQNEAWQQAKAHPSTGSGPALRISAEDEAAVDGSAGYGEPEVADSAAAPATGVAAEAGEATGGSSAAEMAALKRQVDTLQRMIDVKDEQIAALQNALTEGEDARADEEELADGAVELVDDYSEATEEELAEDVVDAVDESDAEEAVAEEVEVAEEVGEAEKAEPVAAPAKPKSDVPKVTSRKPAEKSSGGIMDYLYYIIGALVLAVVGFFVVRRRGDEDDAPAPAEAKKDVFSDVKLKEESVAVETPAAAAAPVASTADDASSRGYGEHKHDAYASDVEAADALAEADIYIAYGRHRQAIDLLNNALASEPGTPVYLLKLIEIYTELNDRPSATVQMEKLVNTGDEGSIARAEAVMEKFDQEQPAAAPAAEPAPSREVESDGSGLAPNPLEMMSDSDEGLESDFDGLEIETGDEDEDDDLDLSADFEDEDEEEDDGEELVIAADANGLSTKMDLARAYLDMGDDDGARQILEEVIAEGSEELKAEARSLLERIG